MKSSDFDYQLDSELIAKYPPKVRGESRLMVCQAFDGEIEIEHKKYFDVADFINPGDVVVLNDTKVLQARFFVLHKPSGRQMELLYLNNISLSEGDDTYWEVLIGKGKKVQPGDDLTFLKNGKPTDYVASFVGKNNKHGTYTVKVDSAVESSIFEDCGHVPLPPYLRRDDEESDKDRYNTVFGERKGSVAAPTASLNITMKILKSIKEKGAEIVHVTLDVGWGTFAPVKSERVEDFQIHTEKYSISTKAAESINKAILSDKRVIAFGTTATRVLESVAVKDPRSGKYIVRGGDSETDIFIYPGYEWKIIDGLVTNFHAPKSSLLMLVSSFLGEIIGDQSRGLAELIKLYEIAMTERYKFLSYGDSMFIVGENL